MVTTRPTHQEVLADDSLLTMFNRYIDGGDTATRHDTAASQMDLQSRCQQATSEDANGVNMDLATADSSKLAKKKSARNGGMSAATEFMHYIAHERTRTFHELVQLLLTYENLNRDERRRIQGALCATLRPAERAICEGSVPRRPVRDGVRALCYGARLNTDVVRELCLARLEQLGIRGLSTSFITDKFLVKNIDAWYTYAPLDACEWLHSGVFSENVLDMLKNNSPLKGRACRCCVTALLKLSRHGLSVELSRFDANGQVDKNSSTTPGASTAAAPLENGGGEEALRKRTIAVGNKRKEPSTPSTSSKKSPPANKRKKKEISRGDDTPAAGSADMPDISMTEPFLQQLQKQHQPKHQRQQQQPQQQVKPHQQSQVQQQFKQPKQYVQESKPQQQQRQQKYGDPSHIPLPVYPSRRLEIPKKTIDKQSPDSPLPYSDEDDDYEDSFVDTDEESPKN